MKSFDINAITRQNILSLLPYHVWRDDYLEVSDAAFLDNCENNYGSPLGKGYERYPSSSQKEIKEAIAKLKNVNPGQVALGNGSDELIDLSIRSFCEPGQDNILVCEPTFSMFRVYAGINNIEVLSAPLKKEDFSYDTGLILSTKNKRTKLIFICSPNNPTGSSISREDLVALCTEFSGIVIVDEAYVDFSKKGSMLDLARQLPNLLILQTFSKAWGLAALRLGMALGNEAITSILTKVRPPFNVNGITQQLIMDAIKKQTVKDEYVKEILRQKRMLQNQFRILPVVEKIIESDANYFLLKVRDAKGISEYLLSKNILISNRSAQLNCENHVRISVGTAEENERLIKELKSYS
jgi:histidinol-phosphate aminotransferase